MEEVIISLLEKSIVGGAFVYLLYYFTTFLSKLLGDMSTTIEKLGETLTSISNTLTKMDMRMESVEQRIKRLEEK